MNDKNNQASADERHNPDSQIGQSIGDRGSKDKVRGKLNQAGGKAQEGLGKLTNKKDLKHKGQLRQAKGKFQDTAGNVERKTHDTLDH